MTGYVESLIQEYKSKGILVDTNILLVVFFGALDRERIASRPGTKSFTAEDYDLINVTLTRFRTIVTTPSILTEVSSFINKLSDPDRSNCYQLLSEALSAKNASQSVLEVYKPSQEIASIGWPFAKYGLTDCSIAEIASGKYLVLTEDLKLSAHLNERAIDTVSFVQLKYGA